MLAFVGVKLPVDEHYLPDTFIQRVFRLECIKRLHRFVVIFFSEIRHPNPEFGVGNSLLGFCPM